MKSLIALGAVVATIATASAANAAIIYEESPMAAAANAASATLCGMYGCAQPRPYVAPAPVYQPTYPQPAYQPAPEQPHWFISVNNAIVAGPMDSNTCFRNEHIYATPGSFPSCVIRY